MLVCIVAFDQFTDIDVFLPWDLLNRVKKPGWQVQLVGESTHHTSIAGLTIPMHGPLELTSGADAVLFASGPGTRKKMNDSKFLGSFHLDPTRQLIGSMCSGALLLAALGLLEGREATTYPTAKTLLERFGVRVVERPFVQEGNVATAAGCLAALSLAGWVVERLAGPDERSSMLLSVQPVGEGLHFTDAVAVDRVYATP